MKQHTCTIHRIGLHTAWIAVEGDRNHQLIAVPKNLVSSNSDPDGPQPGVRVQVSLPSWVREVANVQ